jgi:hypothetical protein
MHKQAIFGMALVAMIVVAQAPVALAQDNRFQKIEDRLRALEQRIAAHDRSDFSIGSYLPGAIVVLAIALFCGRWAHQNGRDFWLWFLGALIFNIFALIWLWCVIGDDKSWARRKAKEQAAKEAQEL